MPGPRPPSDGSDALDPERGGLLHGRSPREILFRIAEGDPLELGPRIEAVLDEEGLLLDSGRVHLRALAATAYAACANGPPRDIGPWMRDRIAESVSGLLAEDREAERGAAPGLCCTDRSLALLQRRLVRRIVHDGAPLTDIARELGCPLAKAKAELREAVESLERAIGTRLADRLGGGDRG